MGKKFRFLSLMLVLCLCITSLGVQGASEENQEVLPAREQTQTEQQPVTISKAAQEPEVIEHEEDSISDTGDVFTEEAPEEQPEEGKSAQDGAEEPGDDIKDELTEDIEDEEDSISDTGDEFLEEVTEEQPEEDTSVQDDAEAPLPVQENTLAEDGEDLEFLEDEPGAIKINFQPSGSEVPEGYIPDYGEVYGARNGYIYGWNTSYIGTTRDRGINADQKLDTLVTLYKTGKWEIEVEDGFYEVTVCAGDAGFSSAPTVNVDGVNYWSAVELGANQFVQKTTAIDISDGKITIDNGGTADALTKLNYVKIVKVNPAFLSSLTISTGTLSPAFDESTFSYTADVPYDVSSIALIPTVGDNGAVITVNGEQVESGGTSGPIGLEVGSNTILVRVKAPDGSSVAEYTITVERKSGIYFKDIAAGSYYTVALKEDGTVEDNPVFSSKLTNLTLTSGTQTITLVPAFNMNTLIYTASVPYDISSVVITPAPEDVGAVIKINGTAIPSRQTSATVSLNVGANAIPVQVTAADGSSQTTYTVTVTKEANPIYLTNLVLGNGASFETPFTSQTLTYNVDVPYDAATFTITPSSNDASATITINGTTVASGSAYTATSPAAGTTGTFTVVISAPGSSPSTYTLNAIRSSNNYLSTLTITPPLVRPSPVFSCLNLNYTINTTVGAITLAYSPAAPNATVSVTVNDVPVTGGSPVSISFPSAGTYTIKITVASAYGNDRRTYIIVVTKA